MMDRRRFLLISLAGVLAAPLAAVAQRAAKIPRVGLLANVRSPAIEAFLNGMRDLGYIEGPEGEGQDEEPTKALGLTIRRRFWRADQLIE